MSVKVGSETGAPALPATAWADWSFGPPTDRQTVTASSSLDRLTSAWRNPAISMLKLVGVILALVVLGAPLVGEAQQAGKVFRVAVLGVGINERSAPFFVAFEKRLRELGYVDGQNLVLQYRGAQQKKSLDEEARSVAQGPIDVIITTGPEAPLKAARQATATIPIVTVAINYDPVAKGYVRSLASPGGNVTGVFYQQSEVGAKQLELLTQTLPQAARVAVVWEPYSADQLEAVESAARTLRTPIQKVEVPPPYDFEAAFRTVERGRAEGVLLMGSPVVFRERVRIAELALRHRLPSAGGASIAYDSGVLLGFGPDLNALFRRAAEYADRILKGAKPADLPVEQPTKFELVINMRTAKALGVTIPPALLLRADRVVE